METTKINTVEDLALLSGDSSAIVFVAGIGSEVELLTKEIFPSLIATEKLITLDPSSRLFLEMEGPPCLPCVGFWTAKGALVGYLELDRSIDEYLVDCRRFT